MVMPLQDKMNKVLDLWSRSSTFPSYHLTKLKGLVNEATTSAQGAYFEHYLVVLPSILYHVRNCITHVVEFTLDDWIVHSRSNDGLIYIRSLLIIIRNILLLHSNPEN